MVVVVDCAYPPTAQAERARVADNCSLEMARSASCDDRAPGTSVSKNAASDASRTSRRAPEMPGLDRRARIQQVGDKLEALWRIARRGSSPLGSRSVDRSR